MPRIAHLLLSGLILLSCASCSEDDAVLALNVTLEDSARAASTLDVTLTQGGQSKLTSVVSVPTMPADGGMISKREFYERITLSGVGAGQAMLSVEAKQGATSLGSAQTMIEVALDGAVAGFVTVGKPTPVMDAGMSK